MKYLFFSLLSLIALSANSQSGHFTINLKITNPSYDKVYIRYPDKDGKSIIDSAELKGGSFTLKGLADGPTLAVLYNNPYEREKSEFIRIFLEPSNISIEGNSLKEAKISGSATQAEFDVYQQKTKKVERRWASIMDTLSAVNKRSNAAYQEMKGWLLRPFNMEMNEINAEFIKNHPASNITAYLAGSVGLSTDSMKKVYALLPEKVKQSSFGKGMVAEWEKRKVGVPGTIAASFSATDINGQSASLDDYKGKYVLVDFWASWCVPCRASNPHLKELYAMYKEKGFDIIGVADDDRQPDAWKRAVEKDQLPWKHVLRGVKFGKNGSNSNIDRSNDISEGYNVTSLPTQVLVDPNGKIIARYGGGGEGHEGLDEKLKTIFK